MNADVPARLLHALLSATDEMRLPLTVRQVEALAERAATAYRAPLPQLTPQDFTGQQYAVLLAMGQGETVHQTAARMYVKPHTVRAHRRRVLRRLGASSVGDAVARARDIGLLRHPQALPRPGSRAA